MCTLHTLLLLLFAITRISAFPHGAGAFSLGEQLPGAGHLPNPIRKPGREEQGQQQGGCSKLSSPHQHHLGAERDRSIAARRAGLSTRDRKPGLAASPSLPAALAFPSTITSLLRLPLGSRSILRAA